MRQTRAGESRELEGARGSRLHYRAWTPSAPRGALLVVHGLFEHGGRYRELARVAGEAGIATLALDLRGHGASEGRRGHVRRFEDFLEDVDRFLAVADQALPEAVPRFLLGHSMGGLIAIRYLEEYRPALGGAVLTSPWLGTAADVPGWQRAAAAILERVLPAVPIPADIDPDDLSHDPERVADYRDDSAIFSTLTPRLWGEVARAQEAALRRRDRLEGPLLFLVAGDDRVADTATTTAFVRSLTHLEDVTMEVMEGYYHEVLQETGRAVVMAQILEWIRARRG